MTRRCGKSQARFPGTRGLQHLHDEETDRAAAQNGDAFEHAWLGEANSLVATPSGSSMTASSALNESGSVTS